MSADDRIAAGDIINYFHLMENGNGRLLDRLNAQADAAGRAGPAAMMEFEGSYLGRMAGGLQGLGRINAFHAIMQAPPLPAGTPTLRQSIQEEIDNFTHHEHNADNADNHDAAQQPARPRGLLGNLLGMFFGISGIDAPTRNNALQTIDRLRGGYRSAFQEMAGNDALRIADLQRILQEHPPGDDAGLTTAWIGVMNQHYQRNMPIMAGVGGINGEVNSLLNSFGITLPGMGANNPTPTSHTGQPAVYEPQHGLPSIFAMGSTTPFRRG